MPLSLSEDYLTDLSEGLKVSLQTVVNNYLGYMRDISDISEFQTHIKFYLYFLDIYKSLEGGDLTLETFLDNINNANLNQNIINEENLKAIFDTYNLNKTKNRADIRNCILNVIDEEKTRGNSATDRFDNEGVFQILRVGKTPTGATYKEQIDYTEFPDLTFEKGQDQEQRLVFLADNQTIHSTISLTTADIESLKTAFDKR
jgi:hypothetical protein